MNAIQILPLKRRWSTSTQLVRSHLVFSGFSWESARAGEGEQKYFRVWNDFYIFLYLHFLTIRVAEPGLVGFRGDSRSGESGVLGRSADAGARMPLALADHRERGRS